MKLFYLYSKFVKIIQGTCVINSNIDKTLVVGTSCNVVRLKMDKYSYFGDNCQIVNAKIGAFCSISRPCFYWRSRAPYGLGFHFSGVSKCAA